MKQPIHILYIPGLGDKNDSFRRRALGWWKYKNITAELVPMNWSTNESYSAKFERVSAAIDSVKDKKVVLVGESAGGSMAVNVYSARPNDIHRAMTLCGKNTHPENVSPTTYRNNPAFRPSMDATIQSVHRLTPEQKRAFVSITPLYDPTVPVAQTLLPGCRHVWLWTVGHVVPIVMGLTVLSWVIVREARR
jgi:dienelactone hydrolase